MKLNWRGKILKQQFQAAAIDALSEIDLRIEATAKAQLYPGHGKLYGPMQRSIEGEQGRVSGKRIIGRVGTKGIPYARRQHRRFRYIYIGLEDVKPQAPAILAEHMKRKAS